jgi:uncharacterized protein YcnI
MKKPILVLSLGCALAAAHAHVTLLERTAPADSSYKAVFRVGHGCGRSPTRQLVVDIPAGMQGARPMPKPGWRIELQKTDNRVTRITWTARTAEDKLSTEFYDEFVVVARTPSQPGFVYWPVVQVCDEGQGNWVQVPKPGQSLSDLEGPAAQLEVLPAPAGAAPQRH